MIRMSIYIILFFILLSITPAYSLDMNQPNWYELKSSKYGRQLYDINSIKYISDDNLIVHSRFFPINSKKYISYKTNIDCSTNNFRDLEVSGKLIQNPSWSSTHGDYLLEQLVDSTCSKN